MSDYSAALRYGELKAASDAELMMHLKGGYHDALAVIVERYKRLVWGVAIKIVHDSGEAEELVQAVFLEVFQKAETFDEDRGTVKTWLLQLAYTRSVNRFHHLRRLQVHNQSELDQDCLPSNLGKTRLGFSNVEAARLVQQLLATLDANQKAAIELIMLEGLSFNELAKRTGQTLSNAKHHYYRGMLKLRDCVA
jgi:RNA polymerase sigma-70 factor, ECF subfamily